MDDLRLIGVHEDGEHLLLATGDGDRFRLRVDDAVRAAVRRDRPRLGQLQIEIAGGVRPREVQAMIRAGATAQEVAERTGWPVEKVERFEGPVVAERAHIAGLAREVRLRGHNGSSAATLGSRVTERLTARGVEADHVMWDSSRSDDGAWRVTVTFPAGGRERTATWHYDVASRTVSARDDEARWLAEDDSADGPIPSGSRARGSTVFDVEAEGGVEGDREGRAADEPGRNADSDEPIDLMTAIREHSSAKGRRRGSRRRTGATPRPSTDEALPLDDTSTDPEPRLGDDEPDDDGTDERAKEDIPEDGRSEAAGSGQVESRPVRKARKGRTSVPSWDDVMFGGGRRGS
jgi:hypothetical protein